MKKTARRKVTFRMPAEPGSRVSVAGTFNDWDPDKHLMTDKTEPGVFQVANGHGTLNSVLTVQA